jgi:hypothetical protein
MARKRTPAGAIAGAGVAAVVVLAAVVYFVFAGPKTVETTPAEEKAVAESSLGGPNTGDSTVKPRKRRTRPIPKKSYRPPPPTKAPPPVAPTEEPPPFEEPIEPEVVEPPLEPEEPGVEEPGTEKTGTDTTPEEPPPAKVLTTTTLSFTYQSSRRIETPRVTFLDETGEPEGTIEAGDGALLEITAAIDPKGNEEVALENLLLDLGGGEGIPPIQARTSSLPYTAPSAMERELMLDGAIVVFFRSESNLIEPEACGQGIERLLIGQTGEPRSVPVTFLFPIPLEMNQEVVLLLDDGELQIALQK